MTQLQNKVALITGAASGIGAATARLLATAGARVVCADRDRAAVEAAAAKLARDGHAARAVILDVTDEVAWERAMASVAEHEQRLDAVVNCAGVSAATPIANTALTEWRRVLTTNLDGAFLATKYGLRALRAAGGVIIHVGSASGIRPAPGAAAYSTSKAGLSMLARVAAKECRDAGLPIRVNVVSPAGVKTPMWRSIPFFQELVAKLGSEEAAFANLAGPAPNDRFAEPEEVARVIRFLVSDEAAQITGVELPIDGGYIL